MATESVSKRHGPLIERAGWAVFWNAAFFLQKRSKKVPKFPALTPRSWPGKPVNQGPLLVVKADPLQLSRKKPKQGLVKQLLSSTEEYVIKTGSGKGNNLYPLANNDPFGKRGIHLCRQL